MDRMQATPRIRPFVGGLADLLAASYSPQRTQQLQGLMNFLGVPEISQTLDRVSYGEPITQGAGMTTALRPEAQVSLAALLGLVPIGRASEPVAMAAGRAGERIAERAVPRVMERGGLPAEMLGAMAQGTQSPATVYHGSPHRFQRFDASKIGTGEGAQAYGHGLYLAQSKDVADSYRIGLSYNPDEMRIGGKQINEVYQAIERGAARKNPAQAQADYEKLEVLERLMMNEMPDDIADYVTRLAPETQQWFNKTVRPSFQTYGNLYQVDLPDAQIARMIDWDKPLSQQPVEIQRFALQNPEALKSLKEFAAQDNKSSIYDLTGRELYQAIGGGALNDPARASSIMRQAGIPGVRYLDEGSRSAGQGTSNFVVFPGMEDMLRIEQINNQPIESLFRSLGR